MISEVTVNYKQTIIHKIKIVDSISAVSILRDIWANDIEFRERIYVLILNRNHRVIGYSLLSMGASTGTVCDNKILFQTLLKSHAAAFIISHNHPSGNLEPSKHDIELTKKIRKAAELFDISFLDHIIVTKDSHYSLNDNNQLI